MSSKFKSIRIWRDGAMYRQKTDLATFEIASFEFGARPTSGQKSCLFVIWPIECDTQPLLECFVDGKKRNVEGRMTPTTVVVTLDFIDPPVQILAYRSTPPTFLPSFCPDGLQAMETFLVPLVGFTPQSSHDGFTPQSSHDGFAAHCSQNACVEAMLPPGGPSLIDLDYEHSTDEGGAKNTEVRAYEISEFWTRFTSGLELLAPPNIECYRQAIASSIKRRYPQDKNRNGPIWIFVENFSQCEALAVLMIVQAFCQRVVGLASHESLESWSHFWKRFSMALAYKRLQRSPLPTDIMASEVSASIEKSSVQELVDHLNSTSQILSGSEKRALKH